MRTKVYALLIAMLLLTAGNVWAERYYVKSSGGSDGNSGIGSWDNAFANLQAALDVVGAGDEIWIAQGAYTPTKIIGGGTDNRDMAFLLEVDIKLYGGFVGDESTLDERVAGNTTTLSGDIETPGLSTDNTYHVLITTNLSNAAIIDGITISGGNANGSGFININTYNFNRDYGGGMYHTFSSPTITNVIICDNNTSEIGGGMFNSDSSPILTGVTISGNTAKYAGGMENAFSSSPVLTNVIVSGNAAIHNGGGVYSTASSSPILTNVTITGNTAGGIGGGMLNDNASSPILTNVTISGNVAGFGGGIFNTYSFPELYNCLVLGNSSGVNDDNSLSTYGNCFVQELDIPIPGILGTAPNAEIGRAHV